MRNIKLTIEYNGTDFSGWQIQPKNTRTIQGEIEKTLKKIFKKETRLTGSGRTDSGVHALGQVANFKTTSTLTSQEILKALNANLPKDITILEVKDVPETFHAQYSTKRKTYRYTILNRIAPSAQQYNFCLHYPYSLKLKVMRQEAKSFIGKKDFKSFQSADTAKPALRKEKETVRTIYRLDIKKREDLVIIEVEANGFLYKMVRNIVGALIEVGGGQLLTGSIKHILSKKDRKAAGSTAKAKGLCLVEVKY